MLLAEGPPGNLSSWGRHMAMPALAATEIIGAARATVAFAIFISGWNSSEYRSASAERLCSTARHRGPVQWRSGRSLFHGTDPQHQADYDRVAAGGPEYSAG
jgi:hypothetical protein